MKMDNLEYSIIIAGKSTEFKMKKTLLLNADASPISFLPLSLIEWEESVNLLFSDKALVLHEYDWEIRSPSTKIKVPSVMILKEFVKFQRVVQFNRFNVYLRDNHSCQYCGHKDDSGKSLTLDHVIPKFHGGKTNFSNIITACHSCNLEKSHFMKMKPKKEPKRPSYFEQANKMKNRELIIHSLDWISYIDWNPEKIIKNV